MEKKKDNPPFIPNVLLKMLLKGESFYEFTDDIYEVYQHMIDCGTKRKARVWYWFRVIESIPSLILDNIYWRSTMLINYLKIALRNFRRHKGYSVINMAGFAIGMACCLLIFLYIRH
jgi:hypothetical protein